MGILSVIKSDVEQLVKQGYDNNYISKSVGVEQSLIDYIIRYIGKESINTKGETKQGETNGYSY